MDYKKHYNRLIENAKLRTSINEYTEMHHIIPKCMGGDDSNANLVRLTAKEHFVAHHLLYKAHRTSKLAHAWFMMTVNGIGQVRLQTVRQYNQAKLAHINALKESMKGSGNHFYGRKHTDETKAKISKANTGKKHSQEFKDNYSKRFKGIPKTAEHKAKIGRKGFIMLTNIDTLECVRVPRDHDLDKTIWLNPQTVAALKGTQKKDKCVHCGITGIPSNIKRWHNDNCKHKTN